MDTLMPTAINKQRVLHHIFTALKKRFDPEEPEPRPVLEQFLYAICREGATREQADQAFHNLQQRFFDWNEIRVSSPREIEEALGDIPGGENRANRLISFLQEVFETTYSFDLETLHKKGLKQAAKQLSRYQAASDYAVAWVIQQSLGGHALPLDTPSLRTLRRLGLIDEELTDPEAIRASLEHLIPKSKGPLFVELLSAMAHNPSWENDSHSPLRSILQEYAAGDNGAASGSERVGRPKPR
jgi:endonuclease III